MSVLVLGAGGFLGLNVTDALQAAGVDVRCGRRARGNVLGLRQRKARLVEADLDEPHTLRAAMRDCPTVVHLAGHYPRLSLQPHRSLALALSQTRAVLDAAAAERVRRLIFVSSTATVVARADRPSNEHDVFLAPPSFGAYHAVKWAMEQLVAEEARFETTTLCPGACLGPFDWKAGTSAMLWQLRQGSCPPHPDGVVSWVDVRDVALAIARVAAGARVPRRLLLSAQSTGFHRFVAEAAERYRVAAVPPLGDADAIALANEEERQAARSGNRPLLSRELVDLILHGARIDAAQAETLLGFRYRPLAAALDAFDAWAQRIPSTPSEVHA